MLSKKILVKFEYYMDEYEQIVVAKHTIVK